MKTLLVSKAKGQLGKLVRLAHAGKTVEITTGGYTAVLVPRPAPSQANVAPPGAFAEYYKDSPENRAENKRCRAMARARIEK